MSKRDDLVRRQAQLSPAKRSLLEKWKGNQAGQPAGEAAIPPRRSGGPAPLSFAQQGLWFLDQLAPGMPAYNMPIAFRLLGPLDVSLLERGLAAIIRRHETLRTTFATVDGRPVQVIAPDAAVPLPLIDLRSCPADERERAIQRLAAAEFPRPFDLARGPLLRAKIVRLAGDEHVLLLTIHHIVSDTWSLGVLIRELATYYEAFALDQPAALPDLPIQYADYVVWQRQWLEGDDAHSPLQTQLAYWRRALAGVPPVLALPPDRPRPAIQTFAGARHTFTLPRALADALGAVSRQEEATLFMTLLAAFQALLHRYSGQDDIVVGTDIANRDRPGTEGLIGFFVNTLVLRASLAGDPTFRELARRTRKLTLDAYAHQDVPFELLVEELQPDRDLSHLPLFQVMFSFQSEREMSLQPLAEDPLGSAQGSMPGLERLGLRLRPLASASGTAKFDLELILVERPGDLNGCFEYNTDLFDAPTIARLVRHFQAVLRGIAADPDRRLAALPLLSAAERQQLLVEWNDTRTGGREQGTGDRTIHVLFEAQAARTPDAIAAVCDDRQLSYAALNARANRLARALAADGVGAEVVVALLAERGLDFLAAMLAVFKAGGAYLPLDPRHPPLRLGRVLAQSRAALVLASEDFAPPLARALDSLPPSSRPKVARLDRARYSTEEAANLPPRSAPGNLAYVIYTSGSTGAPKGAMVEQRGMLNHLYAKIRDLALTEADALAQTASQSFDISVWQFLAALLVGGRVHIFADEVAYQPSRLIARAARERITVLEIVPSLLRELLAELARRDAARAGLPALRWLIATGEALPPELCRQWLARCPRTPLLNAYGPTECSDDVTHHLVAWPPAFEDGRVPIGRPIANTRLYVLDRSLRPAPIGVVGELYVGGDGVGRGYLDRSELTAAAFVPNPFAPVGSTQYTVGSMSPYADCRLPAADCRLYKSGDLARRRTDGNLEYLGRIDQQVKLRGYRIELGEIEATLHSHPAVQASAVLMRADAPGEARLVAYVVLRTKDEGRRTEDRRLKIEDSTIDVPGSLSSILYPLSSELRSFLAERLPDYMLPGAFVALDALPLTPNGKLDRAALPAPDLAQSEQAYTAPRTPVEQVIAGIWAEVLGRAQVSVDDNFFSVGGHSLRAVQVGARLQEVFAVELPLRTFFEAPTVAALAERIELLGGAAGIDVTTIARVFLQLGQLSDEQVRAMLSAIE